MDRRTFIGSVVGGVVTIPVTVPAQKSARPVVGVLFPGSAAAWTSYVAQFREGLRDVGYIDGDNVKLSFFGQKVDTIGCRRSPPT